MIDRNAINRIFANWQNPQFMKLHAGEMTAQEVRTVKAVVRVIGWEVNEVLREAVNIASDDNIDRALKAVEELNSGPVSSALRKLQTEPK